MVFCCRDTGEPFHNFVTWQDLRARDYVKIWNQSYTLKVCILYFTILNVKLNVRGYTHNGDHSDLKVFAVLLKRQLFNDRKCPGG